MKKIHYTKVIIEGFQSISNQLVFKLDNVGLNLVKGPNGAGKSTLFNAILWAEYGVNLKKSIATWDDNKPDTWRGTRVVIERTDGDFVYRIVRHLKFRGKTTGLTGADKLMIFKRPISQSKFTDADLIGDGLHKSDMQIIINNQLGMNSRTYLSSIFFGQRMESLIEASNTDKRKLFEELFDVGFVDEAKAEANEEKQRLYNEIASAEAYLQSAERVLEGSKIVLKEQETVLKDFETTKEERVKRAGKQEQVAFDILEDNKAKILLIQTKLQAYDFEKLEELKIDLIGRNNALIIATESCNLAQMDVDNCQKERDTADGNIVKLNKDIEEIKEECPTCKQAIKKSTIADVKRNLKSQIAKEREVIAVLITKNKGWKEILKIAKTSKETVDKEVTLLKKSIDKFSTSTTAHAKLEALLEVGKTSIVTAEQNYKEAKIYYTTEKEAKQPKVDIESTKIGIAENEEIIITSTKEIAEKSARLEKVKWWVTKGFGSSGLKAFVFNAMLSQLNVYAHKYSARLGFRVEFSIDMTKESKPFQTLVYKGDIVRDYEDFSGGQKQRVDICIAFAMHDLITATSDINILVMDEVFEGLDNEGVEVVFELIREKSNTKSVYLITWSDMIDSLNSKSFTMELDELGNTYLK